MVHCFRKRPIWFQVYFKNETKVCFSQLKIRLSLYDEAGALYDQDDYAPALLPGQERNFIFEFFRDGFDWKKVAAADWVIMEYTIAESERKS